MAKFSEVEVGQKFTTDNKLWLKVETQKVKRCCGNRNGSYNARLVSNNKVTKMFANGKEVVIEE